MRPESVNCEQNKLLNSLFIVRTLELFIYSFNVSIDFVGKLILKLLYLVYDVYCEFLNGSHSANHSNFLNYLNYEEACKAITEETITFKKIPKHFIVIVGDEKPSLKDLVKLIAWSFPVGIKCISLYDHTNGIDPEQIYAGVLKEYKSLIHKIKWGHSFGDKIKEKSKRHINGFRWSPEVVVNVFGWEDGTSGLVSAVVRLHHQGETSVSQQQLNSALLQQAGLQTPPDLALVSGPVLSPFGCLPWHLFLTQFMSIRSHHEMKLTKFLNILHQYSKSEQRHGK